MQIYFKIFNTLLTFFSIGCIIIFLNQSYFKALKMDINLNSDQLGNFISINIGGKLAQDMTFNELSDALFQCGITIKGLSEQATVDQIGKNRIATMKANLDNEDMSDASFREFVRTLDFEKL
jgi:hypothetical protein